jgi:hypothetical protein
MLRTQLNAATVVLTGWLLTNLTNEYVIDLFDRVQQRATVVVLTPGRSAWMGPIAGRS